MGGRGMNGGTMGSCCARRGIPPCDGVPFGGTMGSCCVVGWKVPNVVVEAVGFGSALTCGAVGLRCVWYFRCVSSFRPSPSLPLGCGSDLFHRRLPFFIASGGAATADPFSSLLEAADCPGRVAVSDVVGWPGWIRAIPACWAI